MMNAIIRLTLTSKHTFLLGFKDFVDDLTEVVTRLPK